MARRLDAWRGAHNSECPVELYFYREAPLSLLDTAAVDTLIASVQSIISEPLAAVFVDTLSRSMPNGDENSSRDMSAILFNVSRIIEELHSAVILVHHQGHRPGSMRGHTSLPAGADCIVEVSKRDPIVTVRVQKMKDAEAPPELHLKIHPFANSVALVPATEAERIGMKHTNLTGHQPKVLQALQDGMRHNEWMKAAVGTGVKERTAKAAIAKLKREGLIHHDGVQYFRMGNEGKTGATALLPYGENQ